MTTSQAVDWSLLRHAYGDASDIPARLERIEGFPAESDWESEPWFSLWSALYHQGDVYSASIAAVPRIVSILAQAPSKGTLSFYLLPVSIALADNASPVNVPASFRERFEQAVEALGSIASSALPHIAGEHIARAAQAAILVSQGDFHQASELLEADA